MPPNSTCMLHRLFVFVCLAISPIVSFAQGNFQLPPKEILELADTKAPPTNLISPKNRFLIQLERPLYKSLAELAEPELKLAGLRINPENFNQSRSTYYTSLKLFRFPEMTEISVQGLPAQISMQYLSFSPTENYLAFVRVLPQDLELWTIDLKTGTARNTQNNNLNAVLGSPYQWDADGKSIIIRYKGEKGPWKESKELPKGPTIQDASGQKSPARTYQDLLRNAQDEAKFDYYAKSWIARVFVEPRREAQNILPEGVYKRLSLSPDGNSILLEEMLKPYSYALPYNFFPSRFDLLDRNGKKISTFYNRPLQDKTPIDFDAVEEGKRNIQWRNDEPATLIWTEAPDGGDPKKESEFRDVVYEARPPYSQPTLLCRLKNRFAGIAFGNKEVAIVEDYWWKNRNTKTYLIRPDGENPNPKIIFDRSSQDEYANPGDFLTEENAMNKQVLKMSPDGKKLYLAGQGCNPDGNRPFLDEYELASGKTKRLWQADGKTTYENLIRVLNYEKGEILTSIESPKNYPNLYLRTLGKKTAPKQLTFRSNPYQSLAKVSKQKIYYKRKDGVALSATLYLPAEYDKTKSGRLPMLMEAYPTEFKDEKTAGQVTESPHRFVAINWASPVFWVNRGYAVLEDAKFPIVGKGKEEPNDTYVEQLVADAEAAIRYVDSLGVVDKNRCAVMGHSYGAFMTANLLCHSNLFAAGLARSGAYNRTLTPFGFQAEERTYWQAPEVYTKMSPFTYADKFKSPLLLIHGDADNNPGTFTLQSERLFQAIKGNGGKARLVLLPYESHGYAARENIMHMLWEMDSWLEKWVKNKL